MPLAVAMDRDLVCGAPGLSVHVRRQHARAAGHRPHSAPFCRPAAAHVLPLPPPCPDLDALN
eukprot:1092815-Rhodomonas_salina.2